MKKKALLSPLAGPVAVILSWLLVAAWAPPVSAGEPTEQVRQTADEVVKILRNKELKRPEKKEERRRKLRGVVDRQFDFEEMAKRSLGIYWNKRTPQERKEFVALFSDLLQNTYIRKIERYESGDEKVNYLSEKVEGQYAVVKTEIITSKGSPIPVDYKIFKDKNKWEVYDIIIEGVSLVNNYRSQFRQIITSVSYEELVKRLKDKSKNE
ncbi:MAG: ABC transporter substrate-binding protein [Nitrospiraceae bacterium]|nr:ABC transporter substrate-binding protein [Nitrospiraceae bacterium]